MFIQPNLNSRGPIPLHHNKGIRSLSNKKPPIPDKKNNLPKILTAPGRLSFNGNAARKIARNFKFLSVIVTLGLVGTANAYWLMLCTDVQADKKVPSSELDPLQETRIQVSPPPIFPKKEEPC